jgi:CHAT domain-containing protein
MSSLPSKEDVLLAVEALLNARNWTETQRIVEDYASLLLTEDADKVIETLLRLNAGDDSAIRAIEHRRKVIELCRMQGIDNALAVLSGTQNVENNINAIIQALEQPVRSLAEIPERVELCEQALALVNRALHPELWATLQIKIGNYMAQNTQGDRAENLEKAIGHFKQALHVFTREVFPEKWVVIQKNLAIAYKERLNGERAENLEQSMIHNQQLLKVYTIEAYPKQWAGTQSDLARDYLYRIRGERADNLEQSISLCHKALKVYTRDTFPEDWAIIQNNLAIAYRDRSLGEQVENLEKAIGYCQQALKVYSREAYPEQWAGTQSDLARTYLYRIRGKRVDNLEQSISHYRQALGIYEAYPEQLAGTKKHLSDDLDVILKVLRQPVSGYAEIPPRVGLCQLALMLVNRVQKPKLWAELHNMMGNNLTENPQGAVAENLESAIDHYRQALEVYTRKAYPEHWAGTQSNLASAYGIRIRGDHAENLDLAIDHFEKALKVFTRETFPENWAAIKHNQANIYSNRIRGERADNLELSISHYQQALEIRTREVYPDAWALTQHNLANAYIDRIRGERAENLEHAIGYLQQSLKIFTRQAFPVDWAMTQSHLAVAYINRLRGESAENLELAIYHLQQALEIRTREAYPKDWALTQHNLANAYIDRLRGERAENLELAISHYQQALEIRTREAYPKDWASTQHNLANAYLHRIRGNSAENLELAIYHFRQVLQIYTYEAFPEDWAMTKKNLANAHYINRLHRNSAENVEKSINHYQQALKVYTREAFPERWAGTQNNLAAVFLNRIRGDRAHNVEQSISYYQQALQIYTRKAFPFNHRIIQRNLGNFYFEQRNWQDALTAYQSAIAAGNDLLAAAYSEFGRQTEVSETAGLFANTGYCLLQSRKYSDAFIMLERGKTRLLAEALAATDLDLISVPEKYRSVLQTTRRAIRALEAKMRLTNDYQTNVDIESRSLAAQLREKRADFSTLIEALKQDHPNFMPTDLDLHSILSLIPSEGALVAPVFTPEGSAVFVIPHGGTEVSSEHVIQLDHFKVDELHTLLRGSENKPGWLWAYQTYKNTRDLKNWQEAIVSLTKRLWQAFINPIHQRLSESKIKRVLFLPSGGLQLLPLHAAWFKDENGQKRTLLDYYEITYAPSAYAMDIANRRVKTRYNSASQNQTALVVGINKYKNLNNLFNAVLEAETIAGVLGTKPLLDGAATTFAATTGASGSAYLHIACHGSFDWDNPMDSALYLAPDEPLKLSEIISELDLSSSLLVTLSACETGISDVSRSPDEYIGLPAGFLQAGAPAIVSSLWTVDDRSTALLMERFYSNHINRGMTGPAALREAQLWLRDATRKELGDYYKSLIRMTADEALKESIDITVSGAPDDRPYSDPFYWAAFTFNGSSL